MGGLTRPITGSGGSSGGGTPAVNTSRTITATGTPSGGTVAVTPGQTLKFTWSGASGITRVGCDLLDGSNVIGYVNYPDDENQLFTVPVGVTALGFNVTLLTGSGSVTLNIASI